MADKIPDAKPKPKPAPKPAPKPGRSKKPKIREQDVVGLKYCDGISRVCTQGTCASAEGTLTSRAHQKSSGSIDGRFRQGTMWLLVK